MQLLDVTIAFALTLAAFATVVTVIMEACLRVSRLRKKNLVEIMKLIDKELQGEPFNFTAVNRWDFFVKTVQNPAERT